ncbi:MAG: serine/threonine protein kinase, partial [Clostridia bacterium]|nr:serine/threonine protein kinase [Clostridia bacterium]
MNLTYCVHCMNPISGNVCSVCGKNNQEYHPGSHHLLPGTVLAGKYVVGSVLGEGGFGITYIGRDMNLDIKVAIKEYFPSGVVNRNNTCSSDISAHVGKSGAFFEKGKNSFLGEARTLAKFSGESSIVSVRDFFSENNTAYIAMEYLEGIDLKEYLKLYGCLDFEKTVAMLTPIMNALSKI